MAFFLFTSQSYDWQSHLLIYVLIEHPNEVFPESELEVVFFLHFITTDYQQNRAENLGCSTAGYTRVMAFDKLEQKFNYSVTDRNVRVEGILIRE